MEDIFLDGLNETAAIYIGRVRNCQDSNRAPPEYSSETLELKLICSVHNCTVSALQQGVLVITAADILGELGSRLTQDSLLLLNLRFLER
jgi:hypothetical protein